MKNDEPKTKPVIFIGNGFNLALKNCSTNIDIKFDYKSIGEAVIKKLEANGNTNLRKFIQQNHLPENERTYDIELLLLILQNSIDCIKFGESIYCNAVQGFENLIEKHRDLLKKYVIEVMTDSEFHPTYQNIINEHNRALLNKCGVNIAAFERIFSINYDLILYWLLVDQDLLEKKNSNG